MAKRACATLLALTILTSMLSLSSISAFATEVNTQLSTQTSVQTEAQNNEQNDVQTKAKDDEQADTQNMCSCCHQNSDLLQEDDTADENVETISTPKEYYSKVNSGINVYSNSAKLQSTPVLPDSYDNSTGENKKYFPPVNSQGEIGSCVSWAQVYYQFSYAVNRKLDRQATYENSFSPKFAYNLINRGYDVGSGENDVYDLLMKLGAPSIGSLPYDEDCFSWSFDENVWVEAAKYKLKSYQKVVLPDDSVLVTSADDSDLDILKAILSNGEVLSFTSNVYSQVTSTLKCNPSAPENDSFIGEEAINALGSEEGIHRMTLVGYNDNIWVDINNNNKIDDGEMGAFKIANSWSENYGNKGFAWVAYDALNSVSAVKGVDVDVYRQKVFRDIYRIDVEVDNPTPHIFLKYTVNSATRTKTPVRIIADRYNTRADEYLVPYNVSWSNNIIGYERSYDGTNTASEATFMTDLTQYFPEINSDNIEEYNLSVLFSDIEADSSPVTVKDVEVVDTYRNVTYKPSNFSPFTLDGAEKAVHILNCKDKTATVYYKGYYTPYIEYKTENGNWVPAPGYKMELSNDIEGYSHKYVIHLDENEFTASVRFHDGNGNYDTNNGANYTAYMGVSRITTPEIPQPEITLSCISNLPDDRILDVKQYYWVDILPEGGFGNYKYKITEENLTTGVTAEGDFEADAHLCCIYYNDPGEYIYTVTVQDHAGNQASISFYLVLKRQDTVITSFALRPETESRVGGVCVFEAFTEHEYKYFMYNDYTLEIYGIDNSSLNTALSVKSECVYINGFRCDNKSKLFASWRPACEGNYMAYISITDAHGNVTTKSLTFKVLPPLPVEIESFDISPEGYSGYFETVKMTAKAIYGRDVLKYQFSYIKDGKETIIQDYSTKNTTLMYFGTEAGDYELVVRVKDSYGAVATQTKNFTILPTYISQLEFSESAVKAGQTVTIIPKVKNEAYVIEQVNYHYTVTKDGETKILTTLEDKTVDWRPTEAGSYTVNLEIKYAGQVVASKSTIYTVLEGEKKDNTIYFVPSENWKEENARFAIYAWNDSSRVWFSITEADGIYSVELSDEYENLMFCRMDPATTVNSWKNIWNQTVDIKRPENMNCFTVNADEWYSVQGTWSVYTPQATAVAITGDVALTLEETDGNIFVGVAELQEGTYSFNLDDNGTVLGFNTTFTDSATIDYSGGYKAPTKLNATGGRYTFTYNATSKKLTIKHKPYADIVELFGDINVELVRTSGASTVFTGSARVEAGTYEFKVNDQGVAKGFGHTFDDAVYNAQFNASWSRSAVFNATGGIYSVSYDTATSKLTFKHAPKGLGDIRVFGDVNIDLAKEYGTLYSATQTLEAGEYELRIDAFGKTLCNGSKFTDYISKVEYKDTWKSSTKFTAKGGKYTFKFDSSTNQLTVVYAPIEEKVSIFGDIELKLNDMGGNKYTATITLEAGQYSFRVDDFGITYCCGITITDSKANIPYSTKYKAATILNAKGGTYTFTYDKSNSQLTVYKVY